MYVRDGVTYTKVSQDVPTIKKKVTVLNWVCARVLRISTDSVLRPNILDYRHITTLTDVPCKPLLEVENLNSGSRPLLF